MKLSEALIFDNASVVGSDSVDLASFVLAETLYCIVNNDCDDVEHVKDSAFVLTGVGVVAAIHLIGDKADVSLRDEEASMDKSHDNLILEKCCGKLRAF